MSVRTHLNSIMSFEFIKFLYFSIVLHLIFWNTIVGGDTDMKWREAALEKHNEYRKLHQALPLTMNEKLCEVSQKWADHLAETGKFEHSKDNKFGENIADLERSGGGESQKILSPTIAVENWYNEIKDYDFESGGSNAGKPVGHFTQVVWKGSKQVCVSYAQKIDPPNNIRFVVVANYDPPGNVVGQHTKNVIRANKAGTGTMHCKNGWVFYIGIIICTCHHLLYFGI